MRLLERYEPLERVLAPFKNDDDIFITFSELPKVGIKPTSKYQTPVGIYTYPLKPIWDDVANDTVPFAGNRPYVHVLRCVAPILEVSEYQEADYSKDRERLKLLYDAASKEGGFYNRWTQDISKWEAGHFNSNIPAARLWQVSKIVAHTMGYAKGREMPLMWNVVLRSLGYEGVSDKTGIGIIHLNEPFQAVFFSIKSIQHVATFKNVRKISDKVTFRYVESLLDAIVIENNLAIRAAFLKEWPMLFANRESHSFVLANSATDWEDHLFNIFEWIYQTQESLPRLVYPAVRVAQYGNVPANLIAEALFSIITEALSNAFMGSEAHIASLIQVTMDPKVYRFLDEHLGNVIDHFQGYAKPSKLFGKTVSRIIKSSLLPPSLKPLANKFEAIAKQLARQRA